MEDILKVYQQICKEVWRNYKHHIEAFNPNDKEKFWDGWRDDLSVMDAAYRKYGLEHPAYEFYRFFVAILTNATEKELNAKYGRK